MIRDRKFRKSFITEAEKDDDGVIKKVGNKWRILKKNRKDYWDAEYDTKADAQAALRAYWANKGEGISLVTRKSESVLKGDSYLEYFAHDLDDELSKEFGSDFLELSVWDIGEIQVGLASKGYMLYKITLRPINTRASLIVMSLNDGKERVVLKTDNFHFTHDDAKLISDAITKDMHKRKDIRLESFHRDLKQKHTKLEKKNIKEMGGRIDTKTRDGERINILYTSGDIELLLGGGNYGAYNVKTKITDKESLRKAIDKVMKKAGHNLMPAERDAIETEAEKHLSNMRESSLRSNAMFRKSNNIKRNFKKESLKSLRHGDLMLSYDGDDIDWDEFEEDVFHCFKIRNADNLVLRYADEACSDEEMEKEILAKGDDALEEFYDSCVMSLQDEDNGDIAIFLYDADEITNFDYKLCLE